MGYDSRLRNVLIFIAFIFIVWFLYGRLVAPREPSSPEDEAAIERVVVSVAGTGNENSRPIELRGDYRVAWSARPAADGRCFHGASLYTTDGEIVDLLAGDTLEGPGLGRGETFLYALPPARYYVEATTGCGEWSVSFFPEG